jgi:diguanylate cyclase (GGDEF)-like protein/PAS domain S-box-containing protein
VFFARRLAGCFLFVAVATFFVGLAPEANLIWVANGVLLAYLLMAPRKHWPAYLSAGFVAQFCAGTIAGHHHLLSGLLLAVLNVLESLVSALLLRRRSSGPPDFASPGYILRFIAYGVVTGPAILGVAEALLSPLWHTAYTIWHLRAAGVEFLQWFIADALGVCIATPACVAIFRSRFRGSVRSLKNWAWLLPVVVCAFAAFSQSSVPVPPFILYPLLVLVLLRLSLGWAALATLFVAAIGNWYTVKGYGPFAASKPLASIAPTLLIQIFIAAALAVLFSVSFVLERRRIAERRLERVARLHALVTENSRDVIIIADFQGHRSYVSASAHRLSGWSDEEILQQNSFDLIHPEDLPRVVESDRALREGALDALVECRVRKKDGGYHWVEISLRRICDPTSGHPTGILQVARDISDRKETEKRLQEAYYAVEALAITDALTGLANRRRFDQCLIDEWRRALRARKPLSLLIMDADLFKSYNDAYGHLRGDSCLKQIAESIQDVVSRPGDLVARFGGEEFAVILPSTNNDGAAQVADAISNAVRGRQLKHAGSPFGIVTISAGCATVIPRPGAQATDLIDLADQALYRAKNNGRNQVCNFLQSRSEAEYGNGDAVVTISA